MYEQEKKKLQEDLKLFSDESKLNNWVIEELKERLASPDCPLNQPVDPKTIDIEVYQEALKDKRLLESLLKQENADEDMYSITYNQLIDLEKKEKSFYDNSDSEREIMRSFKNGTDELFGF